MSHELTILQPKVTKPEEMSKLREDKPFVMRGKLPYAAVFTNFLTIPTVIDMIGFSSGGGPPAFAYLIDPDSERFDHHLWFLVGPNIKFDLPQVDGASSAFLGVTQTLGMLLGAANVKSESEQVINELVRGFEALGHLVVEVMPYRIPSLLRGAFPHASQ